LVLEAKGLADMDVPRKDVRAQRWANEASMATGVTWRYFRIDEPVFDQYAMQTATLAALLEVVRARAREAVLASFPTPRKRSREELVAIMDETVARTAGITGVDETIRALREDPRGR
jgi:hypothetical protein